MTDDNQSQTQFPLYYHYMMGPALYTYIVPIVTHIHPIPKTG